MDVDDRDRIGIDELADRGGVSRRTIRYYVQEGLLPPPLGVGRGSHYDRSHLERLLQVKALQEAGRSLDEIRQATSPPPAGRPAGLPTPMPALPPVTPLPRALWRRLTLAPGVELHVAQDVRLPSPGRLGELATWCRAHFARPEDEEE